ncbi:inhibitor of growth protein 3-like [Musca vetustissima]|uniref:inhibitor of growth protein 3-like n=1 Tax=Musca vetustissima TaxID=27455 RepID=UPI002AB65C1F|nr:inhibitor of growth protein 3-like [Musca vetustissima]
MLYLEDYLEMIEHLPQELRDRFTEMRELDLTVQNNMDSLEKKTRAFFMQCKRGELQDEAADSEYQNLRKEYYKVLEDADEKVTIATQIHELVERYLRRLDSELFKFKCELEADNNGITEILEKRSLEMDGGSSAATALLSVTGLNQKENRYYGGMSAAVAPSGSNSHSAVMGGAGMGMGGITVPATPTGATKDNRYRTPKPEKRRDSTSTLQNAVPEKRANLGNNLTPGTPPVAVVRPITPGIGAVLNAAAGSVGTPSPVTYNLQQIGGSATTAIAAAATQAIVATQQMQQGRRSASMKASYEAIHGAGGGPTEFWISRDISNPTATASALGLTNSTTEKSKKKYTSKKLNSSLSHNLSTPNVTTSSTGALSLASSSSSLSVDSVDMLASSAPTNLSVPSLLPAGQHVTASSSNSLTAASSTSATGGNRQALSSTSSTASASTSSSTSTALTPGSNITLNENGMVVEQTPDGEWSYDPNEPRYCTCNQVSYGDMVACDNDACPYEWFHYPCVGITQPPKGKWYCPKCQASMRRRGNRKN